MFYLLPVCAIILFSITPCWLLSSCVFWDVSMGHRDHWWFCLHRSCFHRERISFSPLVPHGLTLYEPPSSSIFSSQLDGALHNLGCSFQTSQLSAGGWTGDLQGSFPVLLWFSLCFHAVRIFQSDICERTSHCPCALDCWPHPAPCSSSWAAASHSFGYLNSS